MTPEMIIAYGFIGVFFALFMGDFIIMVLVIVIGLPLCLLGDFLEALARWVIGPRNSKD